MTLPIIILNYNSSADCQKCVSFLKKQEDVKTEIIIVDNYSHEKERGAVKKLCLEERCTFIPSKENRGYNAGNNIGLRYAVKKGYKYALIANPDMEFPQTDYLARVLETMESDKSIAVCGSDIITAEGIHQNPMKRDGDWKQSFGWISDTINNKTADSYSFIDNHQKSHYCCKVSGCCLMVRLSFILEIHYFDEYPFLYCEEAILSRQVENMEKWTMYYLAGTYAVHRHIKKTSSLSANQFMQLRRSRIYFIKKYGGDHWIGRIMAILSIRVYALLNILHSLLGTK